MSTQIAARVFRCLERDCQNCPMCYTHALNRNSKLLKEQMPPSYGTTASAHVIVIHPKQKAGKPREAKPKAFPVFE